MTARELAELVVKVRAAQRAYFRARTPEALEESKRLEKVLDRAAKDVLESSDLPGQGRLF